jgi:hypothetical protein
MTTQEKNWAAQKFGIPTEEIVRYHSGTCYDRIVVSTKAAANKVKRAVKGRHAWGGWYHGMPLGGIHSTPEGFDVTC